MNLPSYISRWLIFSTTLAVIGVVMGWLACSVYTYCNLKPPVGYGDNEQKQNSISEKTTERAASQKSKSGGDSWVKSQKDNAGEVVNRLNYDTNYNLRFADQHDIQQILNEPKNYAAIKAEFIRTSLVNDRMFFEVQKIAPQVREKLLNLLAEQSIENLKMGRDVSGRPDMSESAFGVQENTQKQDIADLLGDDVAGRFEHYRTNKKYWTQMDKYTIHAAFEQEPLSNDQMYAIICLLAETDAVYFTDLKDKAEPLLTVTQYKAYQNYIEDEANSKRGRGLERDAATRSLDRMRQAVEKGTQP